MAPPRWAAPGPGTPARVCPGLYLLPAPLPQAGLPPAPRREGVGWVSSWLVCLHSLPLQGSTVTQVCLCWEWASPGPTAGAGRPHGPAPPGLGTPPRALRPRRSAVGRSPPLLASPAPRSCPRTPLWLSGKEPTCPYRRHGFDPWSGKIPHATGQPSPCKRAELLQSCPILCNPLDGNLPGSSDHGIL